MHDSRWSYYDLIIDHLEQSMELEVDTDAGGVRTYPLDKGFLTTWLARLIRKPRESQPHIFIYGPNDSGKSTFGLLVESLLPEGKFLKVDQYLTGHVWNYMLDGPSVCLLEETDFRKLTGSRRTTLIEYLRETSVVIHKQMESPRVIDNYTHWIHCANDIMHRPVYKNMKLARILTYPLVKPIKFRGMISHLQFEAAAFREHLLEIDIS